MKEKQMDISEVKEEKVKKGETIHIAMPENVSREEMDKIIEEVEEERKARIVKAINSYK